MFDTVGQNDDPFTELARIFAAGILRLHARQALSLAVDLEVSDKTALSVTTG